MNKLGDKLVLASGNKGKLAEFQRIFNDLGIEVLPQSEFNVGDVEETGLSFIENAILKARHASKISGLPALADDSGLEVDALNGAPGIYSARYAGDHGNDQANNEKLLEALKSIPEQNRSGRFQCALALVKHELDPTPLIATGAWEGRITESAAGREGFGYDPLFYVESEGCTSAELSKERKNQLSHRALAVANLMSQLK